jgi:hypothetical protein
MLVTSSKAAKLPKCPSCDKVYLPLPFAPHVCAPISRKELRQIVREEIARRFPERYTRRGFK